MFKKGSFSRLVLGVFMVAAVVIGVVAHMGSMQAAANMTNTSRSIVETGSGILVGSASQTGPDFTKARQIAAAPHKAAPIKP